MDRERLKEWLTSPLTAILWVFGWVANLFDPVLALFDPVFGFVGSTAGIWFPLTGALDTAARMIPAIPSVVTRELLLVALMIYILYRLEQLTDAAQRYFNR